MSLYTFTEDPEWVKLDFTHFDIFEKQFAPKFRWDKNVHEDVRKQFRTIRNLLLHSFYEADFVDVAYFECVLSLELSLSLRYVELEGQIKDEMSIGRLLKWANTRGLLDLSTEAINSLIDQRNDVLHPRKWINNGPLTKFVFPNFVLIINGLYENINLRRDRKREERRVARTLQPYEEQGATLVHDGKRIIVHRAKLAMFNNFVNPPEYTIAFYPTTELPPYDLLPFLSSPITIKAMSISVTEKTVEFNSQSGVATLVFAEDNDLQVLTQFRNRLSRPDASGLSKVIDQEMLNMEGRVWAEAIEHRELTEWIVDPPSPENGLLDQPSPLWTSVQRIKTFDKFVDRAVTKFRWAAQVGPDVRKAFEVVEKLLYHSYYVFEFVHVAYKQAIFAFEMALAIRFQELEGKEKPPDMTLQGLIDWANGRKLLEANQVQLSATVQIRDSLAHPDKWTLFGYSPLNLFPILSRFINDLYEDPELRCARQSAMEEMNVKLEALANTGSVLSTPTTKLIMYKCRLVHFDNRQSEPHYVLVFWPIFKPEFDQNNELNEGSPIIVEAEEVRWDQDTIEMISKEEKYSLLPISNEVNWKRFDEFRQGLKNEGVSSAMALIDFEIARIANQYHYRRMLERI